MIPKLYFANDDACRENSQRDTIGQNETFITQKEFARRLDVDVRTVYRWRAAGMPSYTLGRGPKPIVRIQFTKAWEWLLINRRVVEGKKAS